jgi:hypothetical protein
MRELAPQRGPAVGDALFAKGLPSERLFPAAPKVHASGADDAAGTPRVQLSLAANRASRPIQIDTCRISPRR